MSLSLAASIIIAGSVRSTRFTHTTSQPFFIRSFTWSFWVIWLPAEAWRSTLIFMFSRSMYSVTFSIKTSKSCPTKVSNSSYTTTPMVISLFFSWVLPQAVRVTSIVMIKNTDVIFLIIHSSYCKKILRRFAPQNDRGVCLGRDQDTLRSEYIEGVSKDCSAASTTGRSKEQSLLTTDSDQGNSSFSFSFTYTSSGCTSFTLGTILLTFPPSQAAKRLSYPKVKSSGTKRASITPRSR